MTLVRAENLGKRFARTFPRGETLIGRLKGLGRASAEKSVWALRGAAFELRRGENLGVQGPNGSGKSTLLRLVAGIMAPTEGRVVVEGRTAAVLAAGAGLQGELSLGDNLELSGILHGLTRRETLRRRDQILDFAGLRPLAGVRTAELSSGQAARASFSAALHCDFDLLLLDEALAVGDAEFSGRCETALRALSSEGKALIAVSHDAQALGRLCGSILELRDGRPAEAAGA